jgi:hypothetical protein
MGPAPVHASSKEANGVLHYYGFLSIVYNIISLVSSVASHESESFAKPNTLTNIIINQYVLKEKS